MKLRLTIEPIIHESMGDPNNMRKWHDWHAEHFAERCVDARERCPIGDIFCPFDKPCAEVTSDDWHEIMEVVI